MRKSLEILKISSLDLIQMRRKRILERWSEKENLQRCAGACVPCAHAVSALGGHVCPLGDTRCDDKLYVLPCFAVVSFAMREAGYIFTGRATV